MSLATRIVDQVYWRVPQDVRRLTFRLLRRRSYRSLQRLRSEVTEDGYTLRSFDDRRCIFVHIPKCAGFSVARSLFGNLAGGHLTVRKYQMIYRRREFSEYFKFTFVRNPWDRVVSAFFFLKEGGVNEVDK
ncbi:MAG TPA: sulfotransferase family 2 domain-containing protein, partial [Longimicrobiales bacterium]|nr:sulfotransferase family 2 domain-containing protein [Longimicrobiales bacterium]